MGTSNLRFGSCNWAPARWERSSKRYNPAGLAPPRRFGRRPVVRASFRNLIVFDFLAIRRFQKLVMQFTCQIPLGSPNPFCLAVRAHDKTARLAFSAPALGLTCLDAGSAGTAESDCPLAFRSRMGRQ